MTTSDAATRACRKWPRLYLDSAEIIRIAEKRTDDAVVEALISVMRDRFAILVVSIEHIHEALPSGDSGAPSRVADALERFTLRAVVTTGPYSIEPWTSDAADIEIEMAANIRELLMSPLAAPKLAELSAGQDVVHEAIVRGLGVARLRSRSQFPRAARELRLRSLVTLVRGWMGSHAAPIVRKWGIELGALNAAERETVVQSLEPIEEILRVAGPTIEALGIDRTELVRRMALGSSVEGMQIAPGTFLVARLSEARVKDSGRKPRRSDVLDLLHVMHVPYVDVATCDREVFAAVSPYVGHVNGSRRVALFRNGQLREVVHALEALPVPSPSG